MFCNIYTWGGRPNGTLRIAAFGGLTFSSSKIILPGALGQPACGPKKNNSFTLFFSVIAEQSFFLTVNIGFLMVNSVVFSKVLRYDTLPLSL